MDRKNLLLYGENGCGKSSIYWALYTIFQSCIKRDNDQVKKYFDPSHIQNLRNRFCRDADSSGITVCFSDELERSLTREISFDIINTIGDTFMYKTLLSSDFINYTYLAKIYDFRNSENIDIFPLLVKDLFPFIDLEEDFKNENDEILLGQSLASEWWNYINTIPSRLPKSEKIDKISESSEQYKRYKNRILPKFCKLLQKYLNSIAERTNEFLKDDFKCPFSVLFDFSELNCDFNRPIGIRSKDAKLHCPKVFLNVEYIHPKLEEGKSKIIKPHTFLNEAKLTSIALSIRLAIIDLRLKSPDAAKVLVLDDLLVSLDMSNRDIVLDVILKQAQSYQLLIFTHDRAFYNLAQMRIKNSNDSENWVFKEMYQKTLKKSDIPRPIFINPNSYLDCVIKYLDSYDYPAAANYLRKGTEHILLELLPKNKTLVVAENGESKPAPLEKLILNFKEMCNLLKIDFSHYEKLMEYKNLLLNPLSHDNISAPIYKQELISCYELLLEIKRLKKEVICNVDKNESFSLYIHDSQGIQWIYSIKPLENFFVIRKDDILYLNNPKCLFLKRKNQVAEEEILNKETLFLRGFKNIKFALKRKDDEIKISDLIYKDGSRIF